ncbi:MAG: ATP-binding protein [Lachnospiraceae bacterium]|nr:ATP-binding protein [Lachnospiraceae bacterium]
MESNRELIRSAFIRMMIVNMFVMMASNLCSFIDNIIISRVLGTDALAAVGYFSPVATAVGLYNMIILGAQVLCGNFIGGGKKDQVNSLFISVFIYLGILSSAFAIAGIVFRDNLSAMLGAEGEVHNMLSGYILGYLPGIPAQALCAMLMALVAFNNDMRRSYVSAIVMAVVNAVADQLLAGMGTFGIGLASTLSSVMALAVLLPGYCRKDRTLHFTKLSPKWKPVMQAAKLGVPSLMFTMGLIVKNTMVNYTLSTYTGAAGVAVASVLSSVCCILGIVSGGFGTAFLSLDGLYYGESDRESFIELYRIAFRIGEACFITIVAVIMLCATPLSNLFFEPGSDAWEMGRRMFLLGFLFYPVNIFMSCLLNSYHAQGNMRLVNIMSAAETSMIGLMIAVTVPFFGTDAAWLSNTWVDIMCVMIIVAAAWIIKKRISSQPAVLLRLSDRFGASPDEYKEYSVKSIDDLIDVSASAVAFCKERNISPRNAFFAGLCIEEMAKNILQHGSKPGKHVYIDVRVVVRDELTIRIRDNCPEFDPRKRMDLFHPESPEQNIGIRLTARLATKIDYYSDAEVNTLIMQI